MRKRNKKFKLYLKILKQNKKLLDSLRLDAKAMAMTYD